MKDDLKPLSEAFSRKQRGFLKLKPRGLFAGDDPVAPLRGRITAWILVRKLFCKGKVACKSEDGVEGARSERCGKCRREGCSQRLRLHIEPVSGGPLTGVEVILELNFSSARNFLQYAVDLASHCMEVPDVVSSLTVVDRAKWGEVVFEVDHAPPQSAAGA